LEEDVILQFDGQAIDQDHSLQSLLFTRKAGDSVQLTILRGSKTLSIQVTLAARPAS
jgi:S1-C subfamily serine protease